MTARHFLLNSAGTYTEVTERVRYGPGEGSLDVTEYAEEGSVPISTVVLDDPDGDLSVGAHHRYYVIDDDIAGDAVIFNAYTAERKVVRGPSERVEASRRWIISCPDSNSVLRRRVMHGADAVRPAETDVARMQALMASHEAGVIDDLTYLSTDNPVDMDAVDYTGQFLYDAVKDCSEASGKNFWVRYFSVTGQLGIFYDLPTSTAYSSTLKLTNVLSEVNGTTVFHIDPEAELVMSPDMAYSGGLMPFDGDYVYGQKDTTVTRFGGTRRDAILPAQNVKSKAKAKARLQRMLEDMATETHRVTTSYEVDSSRVNLLLPGMRVQYKATHHLGYEDYVWGRCLRRTVSQLSPERYKVKVELSFAVPTPTSSAYGILYQTSGPYGDASEVYFASTGDNPNPGYLTKPTVGLTVVTDGSPPNAGWPHTGWLVVGDGTVDVEFYATVTGVLVDNIEHTITWSIRKNGTVVAQGTTVVSGHLEYLSTDKLVSIDALSVADGDELTATLACVPDSMPFFRTPVGAGQNGERFEVTDGSLS